MSYLPGDRPFGSGSFSSDNIIAAAKALPEKKFNDAYARGYMDYKDHVETDYADNYIGAGAKVRLFRSAGQPFLHWSIEPDRMSFAQRGDVFYAGFELVLRMEDLKGNLVLERTEEIPVRLTPEQYKSNERRRFAFQDILPVTPGSHKLFFLLKNKTSKEFTSFETSVSVPAEAKASGSEQRPSPPRARAAFPPARGRTSKPSPSTASSASSAPRTNSFPARAWRHTSRPASRRKPRRDPGAALVLTVAALDGGAVVLEKRIALAEAAAARDGGVYFGPFPLAEVKPGYYRADVALVSPGQTPLHRAGEFHRPVQPLPRAALGLCQAPQPLPVSRAPRHPRLTALHGRGI